jgi:hypothetical protein
VSIRQVVFVPAAPLLVPAVAAGSAGLDEELRAACVAAVAGAKVDGCDDVLVLAPTGEVGRWDGDATWDFAGFGVSRNDADARPRLPWQLGIGAWLLDESGWTGPRRYIGVTSSDEIRGEPDGPHGELILAVGDGSGCRTERAPGHLDPRAERFDEVIADALAVGDASALAGIDPQLADDLLCRSLPVWQTVAAGVRDVPLTSAALDLHVAPYGVAYFVARWSLR